MTHLDLFCSEGIGVYAACGHLLIHFPSVVCPRSPNTSTTYDWRTAPEKLSAGVDVDDLLSDDPDRCVGVLRLPHLNSKPHTESIENRCMRTPLADL